MPANKTAATAVAAALLLAATPSIASADVIADSIAEMSSVQGGDNWYYGQYTTAGDFSSFAQLTYDSGSGLYRGTESFATPISSGDTMHPGVNSLNWAVRRWVSEVTDTIHIQGQFHKVVGQTGGNGVRGRIQVNGVEVFNQAISGSDVVGVSIDFSTDVSTGDVVDFIVDPEGESSFDTVGFYNTVSVTSNTAPVADAGDDQVVQIDDAVSLDGSGSSDDDGDSLTYEWTLSAPAGSDAALDDDSAVDPTFTPDVEGTYALSLVVSDGSDDSETDQMEVVAVGPVFASEQIDSAADGLADLPNSGFDSTGHRSSMRNDYAKITKFIDGGQIDTAIKHLEAAIERVDGYALRDALDRHGKKQPYAADFVVDRDAQLEAYDLLTAALDAITDL